MTSLVIVVGVVTMCFRYCHGDAKNMMLALVTADVAYETKK